MITFIKYSTLVFYLLISYSSKGQEYEKNSYFTYNLKKDTTYFNNGKIETIKFNHKLFKYYKSGNLCSKISFNKPDFFSRIFTTEKRNPVEGLCSYYYDTTVKILESEGLYRNNEKTEPWKYYNKKGELISQTYSITFGYRRDNFKNGKLIEQLDIIECDTVKKSIFNDNKLIVIFDKPLFIKLFYYTDTFLLIFLFICIIIRHFLNSMIINSENDTDFLPFIFPFAKNNNGHAMFCSFVFWFSNFKEENRIYVIISNTLTILTFVLIIIPFYITVIYGKN